MTRSQRNFIAFFAGLPFALLVLLLLINPGYMSLFFDTSGLLNAPIVLIGLGVANFLLLYFGFRSNNARKSKRKTDEPLRWGWRDGALVILGLILFTLPSLWLVFLYPAVITILQTNAPF